MAPRLVPKIMPCDGFRDEQQEQKQEELGIQYSRSWIHQNISRYIFIDFEVVGGSSVERRHTSIVGGGR